MTEDGLSRRQLLKAAGVGGALGIAGGATTSAALTDADTLSTRFVANGLELRIASSVTAEPCGWDGVDDATAPAELDDVSLATGESLTLAMAAPDYSGPVTLQMRATRRSGERRPLELATCSPGPERLGSVPAADAATPVVLANCVSCSWDDPFLVSLTSTGDGTGQTTVELTITATQCRRGEKGGASR